jgi:hypothetical protein
VARRTNAVLLVLAAAAFLTGWLAFAFATSPGRWALVAHAVAGCALVLLIPAKSALSRAGVVRRRRGWWLSVLLAALVVVSLAGGFAHSLGAPWLPAGLTALEFHVGAALALVPLFLWHVVARPIRVRPADLQRRQLLKGGVLLVGAATLYGLTEATGRVLGWPGARRRFSGSYQVGSDDPGGLPPTQWLLDQVPDVSTEEWALSAGAHRVPYAQLDAYGDRVRATLDCTGGFYSEHEWHGCLVARLLPVQAGASIRVRSVTGYERLFPLQEAHRLLLATRIDGEPLSAGNGFPVRLVAPDRRGFWWVKWIEAVDVDGRPYWLQSPFPLH